MPPEGKPQLSANELAVLRLWIDAGALPALALEDAPIPSSLLPWVNERLSSLDTGGRRAAPPAASSSQVAADTPAPARSNADPGAAGAQSAALKRAGRGSARIAPRGWARQSRPTLALVRQSPLLRRIRLPLSDDDHMPPSDEV